MTLTPSLEQLAELLRRAEAKTKVQELTEQVRNAGEQLRLVEEQIRQFEARAREVRPTRLRELETIEDEEQLFKDLVRRTAQNRSLLGPDDLKEAERLIETTRKSLEERKRAAQTELDEISQGLERSRRAVREALDRYQQLRSELDRLQGNTDGRFQEVDRLAHDAETHFPEYQVRAFAREIDDGASMFGMLDRREQYAQLKIWIGRLRRFQESSPPDEERELLDQVFRRLVGLSKQYAPGYIEAFNRNYTTNWDIFIADAQETLRQASDETRRGRQQNERQAELQARGLEHRQLARRAAEDALGRLKAVVLTHFDDEDEQAEKFREVLAQVVEGYGTPDDPLLDIVRPHRDWCIGPEFRNLRKHLDQEDLAQAKQREIEETREVYEDITALTRGKNALMIGGAVREDARRLLLRTFEFDDLEWVAYQDNKPALMDSLVERVRNRNIDVVILLLNFIGHHVSQTLTPQCEESEIPCAIVRHGYGAAQVAEALRRAFSRTESEPLHQEGN
ncbi:hypothetical protein BH23PLA1_BH23PLA1_39670 [soil metagenome]